MTPDQQEIARCIFREANDAFFLFDPAGLCIREVNPAAQRLTGRRRKELIGLPLLDVLEGSAEDVALLVRAAGSTSCHTSWTGFVVKSPQGSRPVHVSCSRIHSEAEPLGLLIARDVTREKEAEDRLRKSEERFRLLAETVRMIPWEADPRSLRFTYVGPQAVEILGFPEEEWLAEGFWARRLHPEDRERAEGFLREHLRTEDHFALEYRMCSAAGAAVWFHDRVTVVREGGEPCLLRGFLIDVTERKQAEEERRRLEARLMHGQKLESLGVLAGGVAHDFNNLLTAVIGYASLAQMELPVNSPTTEMVRQIEEVALRAADLSHQMLAYAGRAKFVPGPVGLSRLIDETSRLLRSVISRKAALQLDLPPDLSEIAADATQVRQVVMNLILNASEALPDGIGHITIQTGQEQVPRPGDLSVYADPDLPPGPYVFVEVADDGCGMDEETMARIFDPFFTTKFTGRGLGLASVLGIARSHRAFVTVRSTPGQGSTFRVYFPQADPSPVARDAPAPSADWKAEGTALVVEDEPDVLGLTQEVLARTGFRVLIAKDGQEGIDVLGRHASEVTLVLLDLTMPRMGGKEALPRMRKLRPDVPIVLMSGYSEEAADPQYLGTLGGSGFLAKPFTPDSLVAAIRSALKE